MWSSLLLRPAPRALPDEAGRGAREGLVLAMRAVDGVDAPVERLRRLAATPGLRPLVRRILVVTAGPLPAGRSGPVRVVRQPGSGRAAAVAHLLREAAAEPGASAVLLLDERAEVDADVLLAALDRRARTDAFDVVALHAPGEPEAVLAALLPFEAVRAVGLAAPELEDGVVADLVLRADAAGFRALLADAPAIGRPACTVEERLLLALRHRPVRARTALLRESLRADLTDLLALRTDAVAARHAVLAALLAGRLPAAGRPAPAVVRLPGLRTLLHEQRRGRALLVEGLRLAARLWWAWPAVRLGVRSGAFDRSSPEAWAARSTHPAGGVNDAFRTGERPPTSGRPQRVRWRPWSTRRGTSAA